VSLRLRIIGSVLLVCSLALPLGTCAEGAPFGVSDFWQDLDSPLTWLAFAWPLVVLPLLFFASTPKLRWAARGIEVVALVCSLAALAPGILVGRPASGFFVGLSGIAVYVAGVLLGAPPAFRRSA
jgi:hypothetical protein